MASRRGRYRKGGYYKTADGREIVGLKRRPDGRFYAAAKPTKTFGKDPAEAVFRFHQWNDGTPTEDVLTTDQAFLITQMEETTDPAELARLQAEHEEAEKDRIALFVKRWIQTDPQDAARRIGIPELGALQPLKPSPTLESLGVVYNEKSGATAGWLDKTASFWGEFCRSVQARTVREITQEAVTAYYDEINSAKKSPTWKGHRLGAIKTVFSFARKRGIAPDDIGRVLGYCAVFVKPKKRAANPRPITPADFQALYAGANDRLKAAMICALNFCMYAKEVSALAWADIDLDKRTLITDRAKTGQTRIAVLWQATVDLLKALPRRGPYVFVSEHGGPIAPNTLRRDWWDARKRAKIDDVDFSMIRDGAYSAAVDGGADLTHAKLLAGHSVGISDYYLRRAPQQVSDACAAIEQAYFGTPKSA